MKKETQVKIRNKAWLYVWNEYKNEYTMKELAEIFNTSLPTFFRGVKSKYKKRNKKGRIK